MYAVFDPDHHAVIFAAEVPAQFDGPYVAGVTLDPVPPDLFAWPEGAERPAITLAVAADDDKHYRVFKYPRDVPGSGFVPAGWAYGGVRRRPDLPTTAEREAARRQVATRAENAGRWVAWTRGLGRPVGTGATRETALAEAAAAGHADVVCEWVPPTPGPGPAGRS